MAQKTKEQQEKRRAYRRALYWRKKAEDPLGVAEKRKRYNKTQYEKHKRLLELGRTVATRKDATAAPQEKMDKIPKSPNKNDNSAIVSVKRRPGPGPSGGQVKFTRPYSSRMAGLMNRSHQCMLPQTDWWRLSW